MHLARSALASGNQQSANRHPDCGRSRPTEVGRYRAVDPVDQPFLSRVGKGRRRSYQQLPHTQLSLFTQISPHIFALDSDDPNRVLQLAPETLEFRGPALDFVLVLNVNDHTVNLFHEYLRLSVVVRAE